LSLEKKYDEVKAQFSFDPKKLLGKEICGYQIDYYVGHGKMGVVFHAKKNVGFEAAVKIMPNSKLTPAWSTELEKLGKLEGIQQVVQYKDHKAEFIEDVPTAIILYEFVHGSNLKDYLEKCHNVTVGFVELLISEILNVFQAMKVQDIIHGDLHIGNIMIADEDPRLISQKPRIKVADFGIGTPDITKKPKDDYKSLASICTYILQKYIDPATLDGEDRFVRKTLLDHFLKKELAEDAVTLGDDSTRNPIRLLKDLTSIRKQFIELDFLASEQELVHPFDNLNCEHFGEGFQLLQKLYSKNFPGYKELNQRMNTVLTGPRGCGKTTIFRNLSFKTQLLGKHIMNPKGFIGIYYHCNDLSFAFPYTAYNLNSSTQQAITHYFNLAILCEILDTLKVAQDNGLEVNGETAERLRLFLKKWLSSCGNPPEGTAMLRYLLSISIETKEHFRDILDSEGFEKEKWAVKMSLMPQDFLLKLCTLLRKNIDWLSNVPFFFFLDDYSSPQISKEVQSTLHNFIFRRYSDLFFKISTENIVTFAAYNAKNKWLEEGRENEVIDLGDYFLHASEKLKQDFLAKIVNNRLENAKEFDWSCRKIEQLLGNSPYKTSVALAESIRASEQKVRYAGWDIIVDLCSGDIANILRLIRNILSNSKLKGEMELPIKEEVQDQGIRETSNEFFAKLNAIPDTGHQISKIVQSFGDVAHYYLKTRRSGNVTSNPPYQAFRLELLEPPELRTLRPDSSLVASPFNSEYLSKIFEDLIKYGAFIRDVKGKSQRGPVVPRLYLRRLLIPTFLLSTSKRDHIRVNAVEFRMLLENPERFKVHMKSKPYRGEDLPNIKQQTLMDKNQRKLTESKKASREQKNKRKRRSKDGTEN